MIIKSEPLILEGGFEQWMLQYPTKCVNPSFNKLTKPVVQSAQESLSKNCMGLIDLSICKSGLIKYFRGLSDLSKCLIDLSKCLSGLIKYFRS